MQNLLLVCKFRYPWVIIILLQVSVLVLLLSTFRLTVWATYNDDSVGVFYFKDESGYFNVMKNPQGECKLRESGCLCNKLDDLRSSFIVYSAFTIIFVISSVFWIISSISFIKDQHLLRLGLISGLCCILSSSSGFISWALLSSASLTCPKQDKNSTICLQPAFFITFFSIFGLITFIQVFFTLIGKLSLNISRLGYRMTELEDLASRQVRKDETKEISISIQ